MGLYPIFLTVYQVNGPGPYALHPVVNGPRRANDLEDKHNGYISILNFIRGVLCKEINLQKFKLSSAKVGRNMADCHQKHT